MNETLASQLLESTGLSAGEASLLAVVGALALALVMGLESRISVFAAIGGVFALLLAASGPV